MEIIIVAAILGFTIAGIIKICLNALANCCFAIARWFDKRGH